jgi:hypothetical protein
MDSTASNPKQQAHELIDRMAHGQVSAIVRLLKVILDPASRRHLHVSGKGDPVSEEETLDIARAWLYSRGIPDEQVLAEFDLTPEHFKRPCRTASKTQTPDS